MMTKAPRRPRVRSKEPVFLNVRQRDREKRSASNEPVRLYAHAIERILDRETGEIVGWLYLWNTGELVPRWKGNPPAEVDLG